MSSKNTWITLVAGLLLATCLWGLSSYLIPSATTAYSVDAPAFGKVDPGLTLTQWTGTGGSANLEDQLVNMRADLVKAKTNYNAIKEQYGWTESFDNLLTTTPSALSSKLPSTSENTDELDQILKNPAEKLQVKLAALPVEEWMTPKAKDDIGSDWVWVADKNSGFWIRATELMEAPKPVDFKLFKIPATSPSKDQWMLAYGLKLPSVQNMDDGKAEYLNDGTVIGMSDHIKNQQVKGFDPLNPVKPEVRTKSTVGELNMPTKPSPPPKPGKPVVTLQEAVAFAKAQLSANEFNRLLRPDFEKTWMPRLEAAKASEANKMYEDALKQAEESHQAAVAEAQQKQPKEDTFAYRWIIQP